MRMCIALVALSISTPVFAQTMGSMSGATSMVNISSPASTNSTSTSTNKVITPPTVVAPGLAAAGIETCLGSASGGLSLMGGGLTFGATKVDEGCTIRLLARQLFAFGFQKAAVALMCQDDRVASAMDAAGSSCPRPMVQRHASLMTEQDDSLVTGAVTLVAERPISRGEQAWFDRASN